MRHATSAMPMLMRLIVDIDTHTFFNIDYTNRQPAIGINRA
jgi:hypothetical protein